MTDLRDKILQTYDDNYCDYFCSLFQKYLNEYKIVDFDILVRYIKILIKKREFDQAYKMIKWLEGYRDKYRLDYDLFGLYLLCFKPQDAERIKQYGNMYSISLSVKMYLMQGKIEEAKKLLASVPNIKENQHLLFHQIQINNQEKFGAFIETEYNSFISNGNELEPGHILRLKKSPDSINPRETDYKKDYRPYMVWKCEGDKVYLFPITTTIRENNYVLFQCKYPNSKGNRAITNTLCYTSRDNILTVFDKVREDDLKPLFANLHRSIYFSRAESKNHENNEFMRGYAGKVEKDKAVSVIDILKREKKWYFVVDVDNDGYKVLELDGDMKVKTDRIETFSKDYIFFQVKDLDEEVIKKIRWRVNNHYVNSSLVGAVVETFSDKYIVLYEKGNYCICITKLYSPSWFNVVTIKKDEIRNTYGFVSEEQLDEIEEMIDRSGKANISNMIKRLK